MLKSILMATDLSQRSDRALHRAVALARQSGAKLTILTVVDDEQPDDMREDQMNHAHRQLNASREALCQGIECTVLVEQGDPTDLVLTHARNDDPDLMVLGPHRERNLWDMLYETTGQRIARMTHVAVLLVVEPAETKYNSVLLATDFSPASTAAALLANEVAPDADLHALHALHVPYGYMGRASGGGADNSIEASFRADAKTADANWRGSFEAPANLSDTDIQTGSAEALFNQIVQSKHVPLIAIGAHGRVGAHRALLGSLVTSLMRYPPCDLLVCRPQ